MKGSRILVGIVFGGKSGEHNVSIKSALTIINALKEKSNSYKYDFFPIYIDLKGRWWGSKISQKALDKESALELEDLKIVTSEEGFKELPQGHENIDVWFPVLHGPNGEDGSVQGIFQLINKPFVGSGVLGSALGMDKIAMKAAFKSANLPQVNYMAAYRKELQKNNLLKELIARLENSIKYPLFIKPANLGSSVGITKAKNQEELIKGLIKASEFDERIIVEEGIIARELECAVLGHQELKISEVGEIHCHSEWFDYDAKYSQNITNSTIPAKIPGRIKEKIQNLTIKACNVICATGIARVDFFYDDKNNNIFINEINTLPGFTKQSMYPSLWAATGMPLAELVSHLIETAQK